MKLQKKFKFLFLSFAVIITFLSIFTAPILSPFLIGGVILQGILGGFSGKVGPVVGGKWKDIDYMRGYVVPANPNTPPQQAVRAKFSALVASARLLLSTVLQPFWDPFLSSMSGFNSWISVNYDLSDVDGLIDETAIMARGTLETAPMTSSTYNTATGVCDLNFSDTITGNGLATDSVLGIVYDSVNDDFYFGGTGDTRASATIQITARTGLTESAVFFWVFCYRGTGSQLEVSDSSGVVSSAP